MAHPAVHDPAMPRLRPLARLIVAVAGAAALAGCTVITVAGTAASIAVTGASLAVDAAVGTAKITGRAVGAATDAVLPAKED
jgi:hypothetical protein